MDKARTKISILCPDHPDELLSRVSPDPSALKHVHCLDCLLQAEDPKSMYANFPKIFDFLTTAAATLAEQKSQVNLTSEVPNELLELAARQAENLEKLSKHLDGEKKKIETFFKKISNVILDALDQLKNEYLKMLDKQVTNLHEAYTTFEKMLKRCYQKMEDVEMMFPTKEYLEGRLENIGSAEGLNDFFKKLKQSIEQNQNDVLSINSSDVMKQNYFMEFSNKLKDIDNNKPTFEEKSSNYEDAKNKIKEQLHQIFVSEEILTLKNPILPDLAELNNLSAIINSQDLETLKEWIPANYKFTPTLLYRLTRDGKSSETFHSLCDKKGPTITLIRCKYDGASQMSIIGGFSDKDFDQNGNGWVCSNQAFIFSLNEKEKLKCSILNPEYAIYNNSAYHIVFGYFGIIVIEKDFARCRSYVIPCSSSQTTYEDYSKIIPPESLKYSQDILFAVEELEVYAVSKLD